MQMSFTLIRHFLVKVSFICFNQDIIKLLECSNFIYGCRFCTEVTQGFDYFVQCQVCNDGLYLLTNSTENSLFPSQFTFCVSDCSSAHYQFINNPLTQKCQDCGRFCKSCNLQYGCETCAPQQAGNNGWVNAYDQTAIFSDQLKKCSPCENNKYCLTCDPNNTSQCLQCTPEFSPTCTYNEIDAILDKCIQGDIDDCLECNSNYECELCDVKSIIKATFQIDSGEYKNKCQDCNQDINGYSIYYQDCASCIIDPANDALTICTSCMNGFLVNGSCQSKWYYFLFQFIQSLSPQGTYPEFIFGARGIPIKSFCSNDALHRSQELCAPSIDICNVEINLYKGDHYILRTSTNFYQPSLYAEGHQNMRISIQPHFCSNNNTDTEICLEDDEHVTVYNKLRDQFQLLVGSGLMLKNIIIDWIDSLILPSHDSGNCLSQKTQCCSNCIFRNIYFNYNTFIETNQYGGYIEIINSKFERFSTCGAVIRNFKSIFKQENRKSTQQSADIYLNRLNELQSILLTEELLKSTLEFSPYSEVCSIEQSDTLPECFSILVQNASFIQMNHFVSKQNEMVQIRSTYNMINQGKILHLIDFRGNVTILDNKFLNNTLGFEDCSASAEISGIFKYDSSSDDYSIYGEKDKYQLKHLISIQGHLHGIHIIGNTFSQNTVIKGLINIQTEENLQQGANSILIARNTFTQNAAYFQTVGIHIRMKSTKQNQIPITNSSLYCTGISIQQNYFEKNFGCAIYGGSIINIECYNPSSSSSFGVQDDLNKNAAVDLTIQSYYKNFDFQTISVQNVVHIEYNGDKLFIDLYNVTLKVLEDIFSDGFQNLQSRYSSDKGIFLYMEQFYGSIYITNNTVQNQVGLNNEYLTKELGLFSSSNVTKLKTYGGLHPIYALEESCELGGLIIDGLYIFNINFFQKGDAILDYSYIFRFNQQVIPIHFKHQLEGQSTLVLSLRMTQLTILKFRDQ
ncbi:UNKNOWN [Stylonychia lemnae]|uniref:Uncharacterized protein n=1 Tax=Stylonychia lemnae TaxID=5949 RepID=A0A078AVW7_STYLE|nr:UNKNOWN [Stylonychia lemnae]|eukprot:CDW84918.1 UNKNOWN [Stylonychia lemnae]